MNTHTATLALIFGQEVSFGTIAGPVDFIDVYVDGNSAPNAVVEWRLYATVGTLESEVAKSLGGGKTASVLKWQGQSGTYSPVQADGSSYELRAYWAQQGPAPTMKASIVGYDEFDTATASGSSSTQVVPAGFGEVTFASAAGYSQFADAAVEQNFKGNVLFILYALSEGGGVEAPIDTQLLSSEDGTTRIFASLKLPGATSYRLAAQDPTGTGTQRAKASLACYSQQLTFIATSVLLAGIAASDRDVAAGEFAPAKGLWYVGFSNATADHIINLPDMPPGSEIEIKDEDGSLASFTMTLVPADGSLIDGDATLVMQAGTPGPKGSVTLTRDFNVAIGWSVT